MNSHLQQLSELPYRHHAYGIESVSSVYADLQKIIPSSENYSYIIHKKYDVLKIDDVRVIKTLQSEKTEKPSLFVLEFALANKESQNALLKMLEEPTSNTYFILVFPNVKKLLPTLQSRLEILLLENKKNNHNLDLVFSAKEFYKALLQERFDLIKTVTDKKQEKPLSKSDIFLFLNDLEELLEKEKKYSAIKVVFNARNYVHANGASLKMILDMIAIELNDE